MNKYCPELYWDGRARAGHVTHPSRVQQTEEETRWMLETLQGWNFSGRVLDVGSGTGRLTKRLSELPGVSRYSACDISDQMRKECLNKTGVLPDKWGGKKLPYRDQDFDLVVSFDVMLHVMPELLGEVWDEHVRVTKRFLFVATSVCDVRSTHCFRHVYVPMIEKSGMVVVKSARYLSGDRVNWFLERKPNVG